MVDDAFLLRRYISDRSEEAFAELVERHLGLVYHSATRQLGGDAHAAKDVAQSVFLLLAEKARVLVGHPCLAAWLHATTHYKVAAVRRTEHRRRLREEAVLVLQDPMSDPMNEVNWEQIRPVLDDVLLELNERDREAVFLRFFEGRPFAEIAARLSLNEKTAHKRLERALDRLRRQLARRGITSTAATIATVLGSQAALAVPTGLATTITSAAMAGAGPAVALTLFQLMASAKITVTAAVVAFGLASGVAVYLKTVELDAKARLASLQQENRTLEARVRTTQRQAAQSDRDRSDLDRSLAALRTARANAAELAKIPLRSGGSFTKDGTAFLKAHPEIRQALIAGYREEFGARYADLFTALGLTAAQIEKFEDIRMNATRRLLGEYHIDLGGNILTYKELKQQMVALLGEAGWERYRNYDENPGKLEQPLTNELASGTYFTETPLSAEQGEKFKAVIHDSLAGAKLDYLAKEGIDDEHWQTILEKAHSFLAPAQFETLQNIYVQVRHFRAQNKAIAAVPKE